MSAFLSSESWVCCCMSACPLLPADCVAGCMAERLKTKLLETDGMVGARAAANADVREEQVDMVVGPDAYRSLPGMLRAMVGTDGPTPAG